MLTASIQVVVFQGTSNPTCSPLPLALEFPLPPPLLVILFPPHWKTLLGKRRRIFIENSSNEFSPPSSYLPCPSPILVQRRLEPEPDSFCFPLLDSIENTLLGHVGYGNGGEERR